MWRDCKKRLTLCGCVVRSLRDSVKLLKKEHQTSLLLSEVRAVEKPRNRKTEKVEVFLQFKDYIERTEFGKHAVRREGYFEIDDCFFEAAGDEGTFFL